eukprot:7386888-Prymnesium_polylepis.1
MPPRSSAPRPAIDATYAPPTLLHGWKRSLGTWMPPETTGLAAPGTPRQLTPDRDEWFREIGPYVPGLIHTVRRVPAGCGKRTMCSAALASDRNGRLALPSDSSDDDAASTCKSASGAGRAAATGSKESRIGSAGVMSQRCAQ